MEALCLISPVASSYIPEKYDPASFQNGMEPNRLNTKKEIEDSLRYESEGKFIISVIKDLPQCVQNMAIS